MLNEKMIGLGKTRSVIRDIFEYGNKRKAEIGADKVFDFSLGNPSVPAPPCVNESIRDLLAEKPDIYLHGYTSAQGDAGTRKAIADNLNQRFGTSFGPDNLYITCGAAASLRITLGAVINPGEEVLTPAPFFPEYRVFAEAAGAVFKPVLCDRETLQLDLEAIREAVTPKTRAIILNSPNNPSGVVYTAKSIAALADILRDKEEEYGSVIYLISDEPYRELVFDSDLEVPYLTKYYRDTIVCYSFSKSLSLPGERIGYILVPDEAACAADVYAGVCGAGRALGYVCAPSLMQHVIERCVGQVSDLEAYRKNRDLLYGALTEYGYTCIHPDGAFYLFVKALEEDAGAFCMKAREKELLLVPSDSFGMPGYVRISYCVSEEQIRSSLPAFRALAESYRV